MYSQEQETILQYKKIKKGSNINWLTFSLDYM